MELDQERKKRGEGSDVCWKADRSKNCQCSNLKRVLSLLQIQCCVNMIILSTKSVIWLLGVLWKQGGQDSVTVQWRRTGPAMECGIRRKPGKRCLPPQNQQALIEPKASGLQQPEQAVLDHYSLHQLQGPGLRWVLSVSAGSAHRDHKDGIGNSNRLEEATFMHLKNSLWDTGSHMWNNVWVNE